MHRSWIADDKNAVPSLQKVQSKKLWKGEKKTVIEQIKPLKYAVFWPRFESSTPVAR